MKGLLDHLQDVSVSSTRKDVPLEITLPPPISLGHILGKTWYHTARDVSYAIASASHALRHSASLVRVLAYPLVSNDPGFSLVEPWSENSNWLLDTIMDLRLVQKRWEASFPSQPLLIIELIQDILNGTSDKEESAIFKRNKAYTLLILVCSDMIASPGQLIFIDTSGDNARMTFCRALIAICQASVRNRSIARLAESRLVNELALLSTQYPAVGENTDIWVSSG